jgi:hypothetical protein
MGAQKSKTASAMITEIIAETIVNDMQASSAILKASQKIVVRGDGNTLSNITMKQVGVINMNAYRKSTNDATLQAKVNNAIDLKSSQVNSFPTIGYASIENSNKVHEIVKQTVNINMIQTCVTKITLVQSVEVMGNQNVIQGVNFDQAGSVLASCISDSLQNSALGATIENMAKQASTQEQGSFLDFIGDIFKAPLYLIGAIILIIIAIIAAPFLMGSGDEPAEQQVVYLPAQSNAEPASAAPGETPGQ